LEEESLEQAVVVFSGAAAAVDTRKFLLATKEKVWSRKVRW